MSIMVPETLVHLLYAVLHSHEMNEILTFATKWLQMEIMQSEISQTQKDKYHINSYLWKLLHTV